MFNELKIELFKYKNHKHTNFTLELFSRDVRKFLKLIDDNKFKRRKTDRK